MSVLELPGFRFHPTEEELLNFYLRRIATGKKLHFDFIGLLYIYHHEPWELPGLAKIKGREWYFFVPRDKRHGHGGRPNRTTKNGFWKATGSDRQIRCLTEPTSVLGIKKTLVFYQGRAPRGCKTDWIMNEYRLPDSFPSPKEDIVLCKIYRKATSVKVLEQRASMENQVRITHLPPSSPLSEDTLASYDHLQENFRTPMLLQDLAVKTEEEEEENNNKITTPSEGFRFAKENLKELEVPKFNIDLLVEPLLNQFSPWLDQYWSPYYANVLNF